MFTLLLNVILVILVLLAFQWVLRKLGAEVPLYVLLAIAALLVLIDKM